MLKVLKWKQAEQLRLLGKGQLALRGREPSSAKRHCDGMRSSSLGTLEPRRAPSSKIESSGVTDLRTFSKRKMTRASTQGAS